MVEEEAALDAAAEFRYCIILLAQEPQLTMDGRTDSDDVHFRITACAGGLSAEASCGCKEAGRVFLGERRQGRESRVQSRHLDAPGSRATKALHAERCVP